MIPSTEPGFPSSCKPWMVTPMSETHWQGCDTVHPDCHHPALLALAGLIAELRDRAPTYGDALTRMADHYESRLREVQSE